LKETINLWRFKGSFCPKTKRRVSWPITPTS